MEIKKNQKKKEKFSGNKCTTVKESTFTDGQQEQKRDLLQTLLQSEGGTLWLGGKGEKKKNSHFHLKSPRHIKCHSSLEGLGWRKRDMVHPAPLRSQLALPPSHRWRSWGCSGFDSGNCTCCWQQRVVCGIGRTSARARRKGTRGNTESNVAVWTHSGASPLAPSCSDQGKRRGYPGPLQVKSDPERSREIESSGIVGRLCGASR